MRRTRDKQVLMHGLILVTILATAKSAEAEVTMEAAFQGRCGHTSPCEQLCYEIHDGMYECDCIEGYELNKNGYSCQVINSTVNLDGHYKSDEDVLYQKGASFSARLADGSDRDNQMLLGYGSPSSMADDTQQIGAASLPISSSSSSMEDVEGEEADNFFDEGLKRHEELAKVNSNDYYISSEDVYFSNDDDQELTNTSQDVPELKAKVTEQTTARAAVSPRRIVVTATTDDLPAASSNQKSIRINLKSEIKSTKNTMWVNGHKANMSFKAIKAPLTLRKSTDNSNKLANYHSNDIDMSMPMFGGILGNPPTRRTNQSTYHNQYAVNTVDPSNSNKYSQNSAGDAADVMQESGEFMAISDKTNISRGDRPASSTSRTCDLDCGTEGVCERNDDTNRCLCPFGKSGDGCFEEIKIRTPKFSEHSWLAFPALRGAYKHVQIRVEFRPESFNGVILLSGERDDLTGDFMALLLNKGFVEFWFDCGSGVGNVRSRETILLNEWNSVIIYRHRWDAWLVLNHGTKVQGRSNGLFSRITFREPVFLGGSGNITGLARRLPVYRGFIGCIRRFVANEHEYKFEEHPLGDVIKGFDIQDCVTDKCFKYPCQHGGKCLPSDQGAVCLCPIGFVGDLCEIRMDLQVPAFNGSSYLRYAPLGDSALIWLEMKVILKAEHPDGLILYSGSEKHGDFIALSLNGGFIEFVFDLGSGPTIVRSEYPLTIGQWHAVKVSRTARLAVLKIDTFPEVMTISSNGFWHLSLPENIFLGGVNHEDKLPLDLRSKAFFVGCIQKIDINGHSLAIVSEALGGTNIGNCPHACVARPCGPLAECIPQMESYECRCNAFSSQCNRAAEVTMEELQLNKAKKKYKEQIKNDKQHSLAKKTNPRDRSKLHLSKGHSKISKLWTMPPTTINRLEEHTIPSNHGHASGQIQSLQPPRLDEEAANIPDKGDDIIYRDTRRSDGQHSSDEVPFDNKQNSRFHNNKEKKEGREHTSNAKEIDYLGKQRDNTKVRSKSAHYQKDSFNLKLSRLPTHYESFQTDPEVDILTFDDNVEVEIGVNHGSDYVNMQNNGNVGNDGIYIGNTAEDNAKEDIKSMAFDWKYDEYGSDRRHAHDAMNEETKSEPFFVDETLFDTKDSTEDYHRKELVQDMRRILANGPEGVGNKKELKLFVDEYDYERNEENSQEGGGKLTVQDSNSEGKNLNISDGFGLDFGETNDDLLEPVQTVVDEKITVDDKNKTFTAPSTQTDWSLLKKMQLPPDHQSEFVGVRKNFGACFAGEDSYFYYNDAETMTQVISYNVDFNLRIKTHSQNGVILWTGRQSTTQDNDNADFLSLGIEDGYLHFRYDLGSGEVDIKYNMSRISDGLWHRVRAIRDAQAGYLEMDGRKTSAQCSPGKLKKLNTDSGLYVGGMPDAIYFTRRKYASGFVGCISEIVLAGELKLNFDPNTLGTAHNVETGLL